MNTPSLLSYIANFAPGIFQVRRATWITIGVGLLVLFGLMTWAVAALVSGLWGQAQNLAGTVPNSVRGTAGSILERVEAIVPGAREKLSEFVPALKQVEAIVPGVREKLSEFVPALKGESVQQSQPQRDVSGTDLGPVARYPALTRTQWQRGGGHAAVTYVGRAEYVTVLDYYAKGYASQGYTQSVQSATPQAEAHEYTKDRERFTLKIAQIPKGSVSVSIETAQE